MLIMLSFGDCVCIFFVSYVNVVNVGEYGNLVLGLFDDDDGDGDGLDKVCVLECIGVVVWKDSKFGMGKWVGDKVGSCLKFSLLLLIDDFDEFNIEIDKLIVGGSIVGYLGVVWFWYLIVLVWKLIWLLEFELLVYIELNMIKVVILMIDGKFN